MTDQPDSPGQMVNEIKTAVDRLNRILNECQAQRVTAGLAVTGGRVVVEKITRQREEEVLFSGEEADDG